MFVPGKQGSRHDGPTVQTPLLFSDLSWAYMMEATAPATGSWGSQRADFPVGERSRLESCMVCMHGVAIAPSACARKQTRKRERAAAAESVACQSWGWGCSAVLRCVALRRAASPSTFAFKFASALAICSIRADALSGMPSRLASSWASMSPRLDTLTRHWLAGWASNAT